MVIESAPPASAVLRNEPKLRTIMPGILMAPPDPLPSDLELLPLNGTPEQAPAPAVTAPPPVMKKVEPPPPPKPPAPAKLPPPMPRKRAEREQSYDPPPRRRRSEREDDYYDPPPAKSKVPVIPLVIGGAALVAVLVAVFAIIILSKDRDRSDAESNAVVQNAMPKKTSTVSESRPRVENPDPSSFSAPPTSSRPREEEEEAAGPRAGTGGNRTEDRKIDTILPDLDSILPKMKGSKPADKPATPPTTPPVTSKPGDKPAPKSGDAPTEPATTADGQIPGALLAKLKAATVFVKVHTREVSGSGSGFVLRVAGDTAMVVTNEHVAHPKSDFGVAQQADYEIVFNSGRKNEFSRCSNSSTCLKTTSWNWRGW